MDYACYQRAVRATIPPRAERATHLERLCSGLVNETAHLLVVNHSAFFFHRLWDRDLLLTEYGGVLWHVVGLAIQEDLTLEDLLRYQEGMFPEARHPSTTIDDPKVVAYIKAMQLLPRAPPS